MIYCPMCGSEISPEMEFCPNCGEKVELKERDAGIDRSSTHQENSEKIGYSPSGSQESVKTSQPSAVTGYPRNYYSRRHGHHHQRKQRSSFGKAIKAIVIVSVIVGVILGSVLLFAPSTKINEEFDYAWSSEEVQESQKFSLNFPLGNVQYRYNSSPMEDVLSIHADFDFTFTGYGVESFDDLYELDWQQSESEASLVVIRNDKWGATFSDNTKVDVLLRTDLKYNLLVDLSSGDFSLETARNARLSSLEITVASGNVNVNFSPGTTIENGLNLDVSSGNVNFLSNESNLGINAGFHLSSGDIQVQAINSVLPSELLSFDVSSGDAVLGLTNSSIANDAALDIHMSSGSMDISLNQSIALGANMDVNVDISSGDLDVFYSGNSLTGARFNAYVSSGDANMIPGNGFSLTDQGMQSMNFNVVNSFDFDIDMSSGDIEITASL